VEHRSMSVSMRLDLIHRHYRAGQWRVLPQLKQHLAERVCRAWNDCQAELLLPHEEIALAEVSLALQGVEA